MLFVPISDQCLESSPTFIYRRIDILRREVVHVYLQRYHTPRRQGTHLVGDIDADVLVLAGGEGHVEHQVVPPGRGRGDALRIVRIASRDAESQEPSSHQVGILLLVDVDFRRHAHGGFRGHSGLYAIVQVVRIHLGMDVIQNVVEAIVVALVE